MASVLDELRDVVATGAIPHDYPWTAISYDDLMGAERFQVQHVRDYFFDEGNTTSTNDLLEALPSVLPPFPRMWMEFAALDGGRFGLFARTNDLWEEYGEEGARAYARRYRDALRSGSRKTMPGEVAGSPRWLCEWQCFAHMPQAGLIGPTHSMVMFLDEKGKISRLDQGADHWAVQVMWSPHLRVDDLDASETAELIHQILVGVLAVGFLHCKNIVIEDAPRPPRQARRRYEQQAGRPMVEFKTLVIEPMKKVLATEGRLGEVGLKRALHICRGHFVTYSEDKPLFGKYAGTFWKPAHVRGTLDEGAVVKDYRVKEPRSAG